MGVYYHVADLEKDLELDLKFPLPFNRVYDDDIRKKVEEFLERYRKDNNPSCISRYTALFVSKTKEQAKTWAQRKKGHGGSCFLYSLSYDGEIEWHRTDYYDRLFGIFSKDDTPVNFRHITSPQLAAKLYWEKVDEPTDDRFDYEGLVMGELTIVEKELYRVP